MAKAVNGMHRAGGLTDVARGWLRFLHRKVHLAGDDWSRHGRPAAAWDNRTGAPMSNFYRFDAIEAANAVALMAQETPAWREVYAEILLGLAQRLTQYHAFNDWVEQRGADPRRGDYPRSWKGLLVPEEHWGRYDAPGWAANGTQAGGYQPDPVAQGAIFYKGFFNVVVGMYELVARDSAFDRAFEIVYDDVLRFTYTHTSINENLQRAFAEGNAGPGLTCEVAKLWPL